MFSRSLFTFFFIVVTSCFCGSATIVADTYQQNDCIECHKKGSDQSRLTIDTDTYLTSVHAAGFVCTDCHRSIVDDYHTSKIGSGVVNCRDCHQHLKQHGGRSADRSATSAGPPGGVDPARPSGRPGLSGGGGDKRPRG